MTIEIDTDISCPDGSKICRTCGHDLPLDQFSLKIGKHSPLRKADCKTCEYNRRKKRLQVVKESKCRVCGKFAKCKVETTRSGQIPLATVCQNCQFLVSQDIEMLLKAINHITMRDSFPFILKREMMLKQYITEPETPLLDATINDSAN